LAAHTHIQLDGESIHNDDSTLAINTTIENNLVITGQWDNADESNVAVLNQGILEPLC